MQTNAVKQGLWFLGWLAFFSTLLLLTLIPVFMADNYNQIRLLACVLLAFAAPLAVFLGAPCDVQKKGGYWVLAWSALLALSGLLYPNGMVTWLDPYYYAAFLFIVVFGGAWLAAQKDLVSIVQSFISALHTVAFIYAVGCVYTYVFALLDGKAINDDLLPWGFINIRFWSNMASWVVPLLPLSLFVGRLSQYASWRYSLYFTLAVWFWVLLLSTSRASLLGISVALIATLIVFKKEAFHWARVMLLTALAGAVLYLLLTLLLPSWLLDDSYARQFSSTSSGRVALWIEALAMSWQHFPLGMGPYSWVNHAFLTPQMTEEYRFGAPHNMVLLWAAEYGWLAIIPLLGLLWHGGKAVRHTIHIDKVTPALVAFFASTLAALGDSFFSGVFISPHSLLMGLCVMTLLWALLHQYTAVPVASSGSRRALYVAAFAMLLWAGLWLQQVARYTQSYYYAANHPSMSLNGINFPRFFEHSYIPHKDAP